MSEADAAFDDFIHPQGRDVNPPSTEAGRYLLAQLRLSGLVASPDRAIGAIEEQARAEGRQQAVQAIGLLQEVRNSDVIFPRSDWPLSQAIAAFLDNLAKGGVAGLNASKSPPPDDEERLGLVELMGRIGVTHGALVPPTGPYVLMRDIYAAFGAEGIFDRTAAVASESGHPEASDA